MSQQAYLLNVCINFGEPTFPLSHIRAPHAIFQQCFVPSVHFNNLFSQQLSTRLYAMACISYAPLLAFTDLADS